MGDMSTLARIRRELGDLTFPDGALHGVVALAAAAALAALDRNAGRTAGHRVGVFGLAAIAALGSERGRIKLSGSLDVSLSLLPAVFAAVLYGPVAAMIVFGASVFGLQMPRRWAVVLLQSSVDRSAQLAQPQRCVSCQAVRRGVAPLPRLHLSQKCSMRRLHRSPSPSRQWAPGQRRPGNFSR